MLLCLGACGRQDDDALPLAGEWRVRLASAAAPDPRLPGQRFPAEGVFVFGTKITDYGLEDDHSLPPLHRMTLGRTYLALDSGAPVGRDRAGTPFLKEWESADVLEMVLVWSTNERELSFEFAPMVDHHGLHFRAPLDEAAMRDGSVRGTWTRVFYVTGRGRGADTVAHGTFHMRRVRPTSVTDSAITRSRRAAREWGRDR